MTSIPEHEDYSGDNTQKVANVQSTQTFGLFWLVAQALLGMIHHLAQAALVVFPKEKPLYSDAIVRMCITGLVLFLACLPGRHGERRSPFRPHKELCALLLGSPCGVPGGAPPSPNTVRAWPLPLLPANPPRCSMTCLNNC